MISKKCNHKFHFAFSGVGVYLGDIPLVLFCQKCGKIKLHRIKFNVPVRGGKPGV